MSLWRQLTSLERTLLLASLAFWLCVQVVWMAPPFGSTDVYVFRDAACNMVQGLGFRTASFVDSHSFQPLLYSAYTPFSQWAFLPFAALLGCGPRSGQVYYLLLASLADLSVLWVVLKRLSRGWQRTLLIAVLALALPAGYVGGELDRPENLSFLSLMVLLIIVQRRQGMAAMALAGFVAGVCFLIQPFAGVVGAFLIAGSVLVSNRSRGRVRAVLLRGLASSLCFAAPVLLVAAAFLHQDRNSLQRFIHVAVIQGLNRRLPPAQLQEMPALGRGVPTSAEVTRRVTGRAAQPKEQALTSRYREALQFHSSQGLLAILDLLFGAVASLVWVFLCVSSPGNVVEKLGLFAAGALSFLLPVVVFPLEPKYLLLTRSLFPFVLALNWARSAEVLRAKQVVTLLLALNLVAVLPSLAANAVQGIENRRSYQEAKEQAQTLKSHLDERGLSNGVVLVPATHYYLYKQLLGNLFNPNFLDHRRFLGKYYNPNDLSYHFDPTQVVAVVNCNTASSNFLPMTKPLPDLVSGTGLQVISTGKDPVEVELFHHKLMRSNWTWECDIYSR